MRGRPSCSLAYISGDFLDSATLHSPVEFLALDLFNWLLRRGIDVFGGAKFVHLQHSWHDDPIIKFQVMQQVVAAFMQRHHYEPSFWLDKACVDQENIADGLRTLPVSVMACNIVLATCGSTYVNRVQGQSSSPPTVKHLASFCLVFAPSRLFVPCELC